MKSRLRILIVDDEPTVVLLLKELLVAEGYEVTTAANGDEALRLSQTRVFDLFIVDLIMPRKDGIETILSLKARFRNKPIIAMSGGWSSGEGNFLPLAGKIGACGTLAKPFRRSELLHAVRRETAHAMRMAV